MKKDHVFKLATLIVMLLFCGCISGIIPSGSSEGNDEQVTEASSEAVRTTSPSDTNKNQASALDWCEKLNREQFFYGKWKIIDLMPPNYPTPSRYSGFDKDGNFRGPDYTDILGMELLFTEEYLEYDGTMEVYALKPMTYSYALPTDNNQIGYYNPESLGIVGNYYSEVFFLLPDHLYVRETDITWENKVHIYDLSYLYLKDNNTIYISDGVLLFLMERVDGE